MRIPMKYFTLIVVLFAFNQTQAKIYKWVDAKGNTHYSESKPKNKDTSEVKIRNTKSTVVDYKPAKENENENENENKNEIITSEKNTDNDVQELTQEQKDVAEYNKNMIEKQKKANCKIAKKNLMTLQETSNVMHKDPETGNNIYIDNKARIKMIQASKKTIKEACK